MNTSITGLEEIETVRDSLLLELKGTLTREQLHEVISWFYLASTEQIIYVGANECHSTLKRCDPGERHCLYQLLRHLSPDNFKDLLCMYEHVYSTELSASIPEL